MNEITSKTTKDLHFIHIPKYVFDSDGGTCSKFDIVWWEDPTQIYYRALSHTVAIIPAGVTSNLQNLKKTSRFLEIFVCDQNLKFTRHEFMCESMNAAWVNEIKCRDYVLHLLLKQKMSVDVLLDYIEL